MASELEKVKGKIDGFIKGYTDKKVFSYYNPTSSIDNERKVGEEWVDADGKEWVQMDGFKMSKSKYGINVLESEICSKCKAYAVSRADKKMLIFHKMCLKCVSEMETELRATGKWEEYERNKVKENIRSFIKDTEQQTAEYIANLSNKYSFINVANEDLKTIDYETWTNTHDDVEVLKASALATLKNMHADFEKSFGEKVYPEQTENNNVDNIP